MDVQIPGSGAVQGSTPIVVIGPNGVGKTRLGVTITQANSGERIGALRNVEIPRIKSRSDHRCAGEKRELYRKGCGWPADREKGVTGRLSMHYNSGLTRVVSSAVEHCLHTAGATGSIPVPPTIKTITYVIHRP